MSMSNITMIGESLYVILGRPSVFMARVESMPEHVFLAMSIKRGVHPYYFGSGVVALYAMSEKMLENLGNGTVSVYSAVSKSKKILAAVGFGASDDVNVSDVPTNFSLTEMSFKEAKDRRLVPFKGTKLFWSPEKILCKN